MWNLQAEYPRFQSKADLLWVSRGLRAWAEKAADGQQVEILYRVSSERGDTEKDSTTREWKDRGQAGVELSWQPLNNPKL